MTPENVSWRRVFIELTFTFTERLNSPARPAGLKVILITPFLPGAIGLRGYSGFVQPQPPLVTFIIVIGSVPVLVNSYFAVTLPLSARMVPKSCVVVTNVRSDLPPAITATMVSSVNTSVRTSFFIAADFVRMF